MCHLDSRLTTRSRRISTEPSRRHTDRDRAGLGDAVTGAARRPGTALLDAKRIRATRSTSRTRPARDCCPTTHETHHYRGSRRQLLEPDSEEGLHERDDPPTLGAVWLGGGRPSGTRCRRRRGTRSRARPRPPVRPTRDLTHGGHCALCDPPPRVCAGSASQSAHAGPWGQRSQSGSRCSVLASW